MKKLLVLLLSFGFLIAPSIVLGNSIGGTGWFFNEGNVDKKIILFEQDLTFTYLNVVSDSGNQGLVFSDEIDTWTSDGNLVVISFTDGYRIVSLKINDRGDRMTGTSINKMGLIEKVNGRLIE